MINVYISYLGIEYYFLSLCKSLLKFKRYDFEFDDHWWRFWCAKAGFEFKYTILHTLALRRPTYIAISFIVTRTN